MDILAARDQENQVHRLQAGAAGKPVNKGLTAKTPANKAPKTPFKIPLNDENVVHKAGKSVLKTNGKGNENLLRTVKKGGDPDKNAFVTPAGPRTRAPLGMKTTNAKTKGFQTPAPLEASAKTQKTQRISPRLRRPKVKVHQSEVEQDEIQEDEREIEYMPPKEIPLLDESDEDIPSNWKFPMFEGDAMTRNYGRTYFNPIGDDGLSKVEREDNEQFARERKQADEQMEKAFAKIQAKDEEELRRNMGLSPPKKSTPVTEPLKKRSAAPSTIKAKAAAAALSPPPKPSYAAPTAATKSRLPLGQKARPAMNPSSVRHASATTASRSTIGYSHNRQASTSRRQPLSNVTRNPPSTNATRKPTASKSNHNPTTPTSSTNSKPTKGRIFSRSSSTSTNATLVQPPEPDVFRTNEELDRELELEILMRATEDDGEIDEWMNNFGRDAAREMDEELDGFQFTIPDDL